MSRVVVFGSGQTSDVLTYYLEHDSPHDVVAFTQDSSFIDASMHRGRPLVPFEELESRYPPDEVELLVAISYRGVNALRSERYREAKDRGYRFATYVSSRALTWPDLVLGENCVIMEGVTIQPYVHVGNGVSIGPSSSVGHHSVLMDHCYLASQVDVSGYVTVGERAFLGANSTVRDGVRIAERTVVGASATILSSTDPRSVHAAPRSVHLPIPSDKLPSI